MLVTKKKKKNTLKHNSKAINQDTANGGIKTYYIAGSNIYLSYIEHDELYGV